MSYSTTEQEQFYYFTEEEHETIKNFLTQKGYTWNRNNVCGAHCGMYADEYWVNGIGGDFPKEDKEEFLKLMKEKGYECSVEKNTISAEPDLSTSK